MNKYWRFGLYAMQAGAIIALDRITKKWALAYASRTATCGIDHTILFHDVLYNRGIAWGLFHSQDAHQFTAVSIIVALITLLVILHAIVWFRQKRSIVGHVLIIAGSLSNSLDRYWYGGVIDFICLHYQEWSWPAFNVADIAIVLGAFMIMASTLREHDAVTPL